MMRNRFRSSILDGTRVELTLPVEHPAFDLHGMSAVVLRCLGCVDEESMPDVVDYLVKIDGNDSIILVSSEWIAG
jgi:hypothetical protein